MVYRKRVGSTTWIWRDSSFLFKAVQRRSSKYLFQHFLIVCLPLDKAIYNTAIILRSWVVTINIFNKENKICCNEKVIACGAITLTMQINLCSINNHLIVFVLIWNHKLKVIYRYLNIKILSCTDNATNICIELRVLKLS